MVWQSPVGHVKTEEVTVQHNNYNATDGWKILVTMQSLLAAADCNRYVESQ